MKAWLEALADASFGPQPTGAGKTQERWGDAKLHNACSSLESAQKNGRIPRGSFEPLSNSQFVKTGEAGYASPVDTTEQSQRTQEVQQILLLAGTEVIEILLYGIGFAAIAGMVIDRPSLVAGDRGVHADTIMLADDRAVTMCSTICLDRLVVRRDGCVFSVDGVLALPG